MNRILLVEDSPETQLAVQSALARDFVLTLAASAADAQRQLEKERFDLILLDVTLPDSDGFKFCAALLSSDRTKDIPVIFLTGRTEMSDRVLGYSLGAEDYIPKPCAPVELRARVDARLRKIRGRMKSEETFRRGDLVFDLRLQRVSILTGERLVMLELTPHEFRLLLYVAQHEEMVFTRDQLITAVWGDAVKVADRAVDVHISNLRRKISNCAYALRTVHGVGYAFSPKRAA